MNRTHVGPSTAAVRRGARALEPLELARWVQEKSGQLAERWLGEVVARSAPISSEVEGLLFRFFRLSVEALPGCFGPYKSQVEPVWQQIAELYGSVAAMRGLAAGEVIEEFQILRGALIRLLYTEPPGPSDHIALRELLRLNSIIDRGVTQASVGHTDALFFALFQGTGVPTALTGELLVEIVEQLGFLEAELEATGATRSH